MIQYPWFLYFHPGSFFVKDGYDVSGDFTVLVTPQYHAHFQSRGSHGRAAVNQKG
jgi:hypothetical protein